METQHRQSVKRRTLLAVAASAVVLVSVVAWVNRDRLKLEALAWLRSSPNIMVERHDPAGSATFDHDLLDGLLRQHVDPRGMVDYTGLRDEAATLDAYLDQLAAAPFDALSRDGKLALLINAYNAATLRLILDHWQDGKLASIKDIPEAQRWKAKRWRIGGQTVSLDEIEHVLIREHFAEPRIHWAVVCAAVSCPPLRAEAYTEAKLDAQLDDQALRTHSDERFFRFDEASNTLHLTPLYLWYAADFRKVDGSVLKHVRQYAKDVAAAMDRGDEPTIRWLDYDWSLNEASSPDG